MTTEKEPTDGHVEPVVLLPCKCGGRAMIFGTPGYLVARCQACCKTGLYVPNTKKGRIVTSKSWNKMQQNTPLHVPSGA